jgi:hypothetical protein
VISYEVGAKEIERLAVAVLRVTTPAMAVY